MKPEYLMLAQTYKNHFIGGWYISEKLDGCRAFWDGGVSRGIPASKVPYANTVKDYRLRTPSVATGLWSRSGKVIHAPSWWLDQLPLMPLDGELFLGKKQFQELRTIISAEGRNWENVKYHVFDSPTWYAFGRPRDIKIRNDYTFSVKDVFSWVNDHIINPTQHGLGTLPFGCILEYLEARCHGVCIPLKQTKLPYNDYNFDSFLDKIIENGGEGVMLRKGSCVWTPERSHDLLKCKPYSDAEGRITGFTSGKGKYKGMIGALILDYDGKRLELSGLTDAEREFFAPYDNWASEHRGEDMPLHFRGEYFKVGDIVTFKYRELSDDGVPKEARFWRKR